MHLDRALLRSQRRPALISRYANRCISTSGILANKYQPPAPGPLALPADQEQERRRLLKKAERDAQMQEIHQDAEKESLDSFEGNRNPKTGEIDGPKGPEPTRYGDWERKGRVTDF